MNLTQAGVKHIVWSTLEDTRKEGTSEGIADIENEGGKYKVPHFDGKGEADAIFAKEGVPTTCAAPAPPVIAFGGRVLLDTLSSLSLARLF